MVDNTYTSDFGFSYRKVNTALFFDLKIMVNKKEKDIIIVNKFKEKSKNDVKSSVEKTFKMYYELQVVKKSV